MCYLTIVRLIWAYYIRNISFLINVLGIMLYELGKYYLFGDFNECIANLTEKLSRINILYVKIFQACALHTQIIDNDMNNQLIKFSDNSPWTLDDVDLTTLDALEKKYNLRIVDKLKPINTGMISLVYKCQRQNIDDFLIIKIKRKNIEKKLNDAIENLLFCLALVDLIPFLNTYDLPAVINKNITLITHQINFPQEVKNLEKFQDYCQHLKFIKIPKVYPAITERFSNVILMEYVRGKTIHTLDKANYDIYAKQLIKFVYITTFLHGAFHGDLHIGNILFLEDEEDKKYKLCILDFGIIYELEKTKDALFDIFTNILTTTPEKVADKILKSGLIEPVDIITSLESKQYTDLVKFLSYFINDSVHVVKCLNHHQIFKFFPELNTYIKTVDGLKLRISDDLVKLQVYFAMNHGVILTLCTEKNYIELADQVMRETFHLDLLE